MKQSPPESGVSYDGPKFHLRMGDVDPEVTKRHGASNGSTKDDAEWIRRGLLLLKDISKSSRDLPPHLEYAFLEGDNKLPVIIAKDLSVWEKAALIKDRCYSPTSEPSLGNSPISRVIFKYPSTQMIRKRQHLLAHTEPLPTAACPLASAMHQAHSRDV
ncbi:hypothetical protein Tco_1302413 [Tanacetum coccineum]